MLLISVRQLHVLNYFSSAEVVKLPLLFFLNRRQNMHIYCFCKDNIEGNRKKYDLMLTMVPCKILLELKNAVSNQLQYLFWKADVPLSFEEMVSPEVLYLGKEEPRSICKKVSSVRGGIQTDCLNHTVKEYCFAMCNLFYK